MREPGTLRSVFLSSTSVDLGAYRAAVKAAIERMDQHPLVMENFGAQGQDDATTVSREQVAQSDLYVLLVAWRYGFIPTDQDTSVTEQEYQEALAQALAHNMPIFVYLADPATDGPTHADSPQFPAAVRDVDKSYRARLDAFRATLLSSHILGTFTEPYELAYKVGADLHKHLLRELRLAQARARGIPFDLPKRASGFVGRAHELDELTAELRRGESVAVAAAVAGMAGVGKSALAAEVVHLLAADEPDEPDAPERFPGGITWLRCDTLTGLVGLAALDDQLLAAWNASLPPEIANRDVTPEEAVTLREQALRQRFRPPVGQSEPSPALVLLDNVEPGFPLGRALTTMSALGIRALVTSRAKPSVPGMHVKRLDVLDPSAARTLFAERYTAAEGMWNGERDADAATEIVEALGYLPLAIELAAARAGRNRLRISALAAELRAPDVLAKLRDPLDSTASVRYAFEQTVGTPENPGALTPTQRTHFIALGLPAGTDWPRSVIEAYLDGIHLKDVEAPSGAADLEGLVALSLVALTTPVALSADLDAAEPACIRLHPLLRQFAADLWQQQGADDRRADVSALLAAVYPFVAEHEQHFATLAREEGLITAVLLHEQDALDEDTSRVAIAIIASLGDYFDVGSHYTLGDTLLTRQLAIVREVGDRAGEGTTLNNLGLLADNLGRTDEAATYYEQALAIQRKVGNRAGEGETLNNLGELARRLGRRNEAAAYYEQALARLREVGDRRGEGTVINCLGALSYNLGRGDEAAAYYEQALAIRREVGDRLGEGTTLNNLGELARRLGQPEKARDYYEQALAKIRDVGDRSGEGSTLNNLGLLAYDLGRSEEALGYFGQALEIFQEIGSVDLQRLVQDNLDVLLAPEDESPVGLNHTPADRPTPVPRKRRLWPFDRHDNGAEQTGASPPHPLHSSTHEHRKERPSMQPAQDKQSKQGKQQKWYDRYPYSLFGFAICLIVFMLSLANIAITILKHWSVWLIPFCALAATFALSTTIDRAIVLARYFRTLDASSTHAPSRG